MGPGEAARSGPAHLWGQAVPQVCQGSSTWHRALGSQVCALHLPFPAQNKAKGTTLWCSPWSWTYSPMRSAASGESPFSPTISLLTSSHGICRGEKGINCYRMFSSPFASISSDVHNLHGTTVSNLMPLSLTGVFNKSPGFILNQAQELLKSFTHPILEQPQHYPT